MERWHRHAECTNRHEVMHATSGRIAPRAGSSDCEIAAPVNGAVVPDFHRDQRRMLLPFRRSITRRVARRGITLIEIMIVVAILGTLLAVALPRFSDYNASRDVNSAKVRIMTALAVSRAGAIQRGATTTFAISNHRVTSQWGTEMLTSPAPLDSLYGVRVTISPPSGATFDYDARGFTTGLASQVKFRLTRSGAPSDSVCVSKLGMIQQTCGAL
jgi:prepilin-type N-terminal cleavage/methylation domain-containing protein